MPQNSTISFSFELKEGANGLKTLTFDAKNLRQVLESTVTEAQKLNDNFINFAAICTGLDSVSKTINDIQNVLKDLTQAYSAQIEAETKLAVNMRNTMGAREEDIQSIKDLCAAQQELGVIGDEVQLAGAQELATYLEEKQSLEKLIPVMNDMLAQQYGLNATQENAAQIATMLGKVMGGQTGALSRYGYTFDDVQEQILKYGDEAQRAAVLCDVVSSSVGGMNAELAKTDIGKQKQLENTLGDIKELLGGLAQIAMPFVTIAANTMLAIAAMAKLCATVKVVTVAVMGWNIKQKALTAGLFLSTGSMEKATRGAEIYSTAVKGSAVSTRIFSMALRGLMIASGIGIAIAAVTAIIGYFCGKTEEATDSLNNLTEAESRAKREAEKLEQIRQQEASTLTNARAALEINISKLKEFNGTKEQEKKLVSEMNDTYGTTMGYFSSVSDWYSALISNSEAYCRQMVIEARTRMLANQIAEKEQEKHNIIYNPDGSKKQYSTKNKLIDVSDGTAHIGAGGGFSANYSRQEKPDSSDWYEATGSVKSLNAEIISLKDQLSNAAKEAAEISFSVRGSKERPTPTTEKAGKDQLQWSDNPSNLKQIQDNKKILQEELQTASIERAAQINQELSALNKLEDAYRNAGIEVNNTDPVFNENASNLKEIAENIAYFDKQLQEVTSLEEAANLNMQKRLWEEKADAYRKAGKEVKNIDPVWSDTPSNLKQIEDNIKILQEELQTASIERAAEINQQISALSELGDTYRKAGTEAKGAFETFRSGWGTIKGLGDGVESLSNALESNGNAWQTVTGIVDGFLQIYDGIMSIVGIIDTLNTLTGASVVTKTSEGIATTEATAAQTAGAIAAETNAAAQIPVIAANKAATASYMELAAAAYFAAHASIPFFGFGIATGFVSAATSIVECIGVMPFANGGIVSGPTVGLIGEYAGASNNPEVVAPLDKLRSMLNPAGEPVIIGGTLRASGREIVCVLANETRIASKSGKRTNIKL